MSKEYYVNKRVAEVLKEKGFDWNCDSYYSKDGRITYTQLRLNHNGPDTQISRPTLQMAHRWLMEKHNICIFCYPALLKQYGDWEAGACWIAENTSVIFYNSSHSMYDDEYKKALEKVMLYVLENII